MTQRRTGGSLSLCCPTKKGALGAELVGFAARGRVYHRAREFLPGGEMLEVLGTRSPASSSSSSPPPPSPPSRPTRRSPPRAGRVPTSPTAWARCSRISRPSSRPSWRPAAAGPCLPSSSCRGWRARPSRPRRPQAPCGSSSAPIVLPYPGHEGTFSQIQRVEFFQTTTNVYI
jgi:hypothetical protein